MTPLRHDPFRDHINKMDLDDLPDPDGRPLPDQVDPFAGLPNAAELRDMLDMILDRQPGTLHTARPGFTHRKPSTRELLREHVWNNRPLVLRKIGGDMSNKKDSAYERNEVSLFDPVGCLGVVVGLVIFFAIVAVVLR